MGEIANMYIGIGISLLIILIILLNMNTTTKGTTGNNVSKVVNGKTGNTGNTGSSSFTNVGRFSDIIGLDGSTQVTIISDATRNSLDITLKYSIPSAVLLPDATTPDAYKWPLLYLIDATNASSTINLAYLNGTSTPNYKKPPPKALLNDTNADSLGTANWAPAYSSAKYLPNLINLTNLLGVVLPAAGGIGTATAPTNAITFTGSVTITSNTIPAGAYTIVVPGSSNIISTSLIPGRAYFLGIAIQLDRSYVNTAATTKAAADSAGVVQRRYGNFKWVGLTYSTSGSTITVTVPGDITPDATPVALGNLTV